MKALISLIHQTGVQFIHLKNLNIDPLLYLKNMPKTASRVVGMKQIMDVIKKKCPETEFGYFNRAVR
jgi:hypothetical protein